MADAVNTNFVGLGKYEAAVEGTAFTCVKSSVFELAGALAPGMRVLDVGCGLGALAAAFAERGCTTVGIDLDADNLQIAQRAHPKVRFKQAAANSEVLTSISESPFDLVICTEVVEHVYSPKSLIEGCVNALKPGGRLILSAPYHGYLKNLSIALLGKCDRHYDALWEGGHIKFFDERSMRQLLQNAGLQEIQFRGAGRIPLLWMSQVMSGRLPT